MPTLEYIASFFIFEDLTPAVDLHCDALGFSVAFLAPEDDPFFEKERGRHPLFP